ncbi:MAG: FKBP-type peptidyl-prolyl cis-trans isomerase [Methanosarcinaceae archaeon]|nr:FKBP-type peptidyl-prolyl cis-trans isomerase [Methanosarcinaceae archaeon]MDD4497731.1 FKBP-type peptidyl-prolyl cis-trans isomerase [Methanosarcinaceae archaeon]
MAIQKGDFIRLSYTGRFDNGRTFDTTDEELAKAEGIFNTQGLYGGDVIIVGAGHTIAGLDEALEGKEIGSTDSVEVPPEKGFGLSNPKLIKTLSITKFENKKAYPGMNVEIEGRRGVVTRVIGRKVSVDFNSPMAGKTVTYEFTIQELVEGDLKKVQGLLSLYTGIRDMEVEVEDGIAMISIPTNLTFNQRWLMVKNKIANEIMKYVDLKEVQFIEKVAAEPEISAETIEAAVAEAAAPETEEAEEAAEN